MTALREDRDVGQAGFWSRPVKALLCVAFVATSCATLDVSGPGTSDASGDEQPALDAETPLAEGAPSGPAAPTNTTIGSTSTSAPPAAPSAETVRIRFESQVPDVPVADLETTALTILNDERGWIRAGFTFVADPTSSYRVVLAEGPEVDALCAPLDTGGTVSCQNGPVVALNADRWRTAVTHWDSSVENYRGYLVNHEVGHLIGQTHPIPRCPNGGGPAGVMEQQTGSLKGCAGNAWPRDWEIAYASQRPVVYAPLPDWKPATPRMNTEGS